MAETLSLALGLVSGLDPEFLTIVALSLRVSLTATCAAFLLAFPCAVLLATREFPGRAGALVLVNAFQGLPPVVVGLLLYLLLSRSGPLGFFGLLFTPGGMILAQAVLVFPLALALQHRMVQGVWNEFGDALKIDGAGFGVIVRTLLGMARVPLATVFLTCFGRAIAEVGAIMIVGGNIRGYTRSMTTAIALETSKGDLALAMALGMVLVGLTILASLAVLLLARATRDER